MKQAYFIVLPILFFVLVAFLGLKITEHPDPYRTISAAPGEVRAEGAELLPDNGGGRASVPAAAEKDEPKPAVVPVAAGEDPATARVSGYVFDAGFHALADHQLIIAFGDINDPQTPKRWAHTDEAGFYRFEDVPVGPATLAYGGFQKGERSRTFTMERQITVVPDVRGNTYDFKVAEGCEVTGRVILKDQSQKATSTVLFLTIAPQYAPSAIRQMTRVRTNYDSSKEAGTFRFSGLESGEYVIAAQLTPEKSVNVPRKVLWPDVRLPEHAKMDLGTTELSFLEFCVITDAK